METKGKSMDLLLFISRYVMVVLVWLPIGLYDGPWTEMSFDIPDLRMYFKNVLLCRLECLMSLLFQRWCRPEDRWGKERRFHTSSRFSFFPRFVWDQTSEHCSVVFNQIVIFLFPLISHNIGEFFGSIFAWISTISPTMSSASSLAFISNIICII